MGEKVADGINLKEFKEMVADFLQGKTSFEQYSPLALAYLGDVVFELMIRCYVLKKGNRQVHKLHQEASSYVCASAQSNMMREIQKHLTEEEHAIYRRGRNTKAVKPPRNQSVTDYRRATGFEALIGYLYIKKQWERMGELVIIGMRYFKSQENEKHAADE